MKKGYFYITTILAALLALLFAVVGVTSVDETDLALVCFVLVAVCAGCLALSLAGILKNRTIAGTVLEKAGVILTGSGIIILMAGIFSVGNLIQGILLAVPFCAAGIFCFLKGRKKIRLPWELYKDALCARMPALKSTIRKGASAAAIAAAESEMGLSFPKELKDLYLACDGDNGEAVCGMMMGLHFLSLEEVLVEWRDLRRVAECTALDTLRCLSYPDKCIKKCHASTGWIPFASDGGGNFIGSDLDPDVMGTAGQIINFGRDEEEKMVLAEDLNAFLLRLLRIIESEDFHIGEYDGEPVILLGTEDPEEGAYLTNYLKSPHAVK